MADSECCSRGKNEKERRNRADGAGARYLVRLLQDAALDERLGY